MRLRNDLHGYGLVSVLLHWVMAVLIIGLFTLGKYMVGLDYYHPWYQKAPDLHRGLGVIVAALFVFRLGWRLSNPHPEILGKPWERRAAVWVHRLFYALIAATVVSGYLITTADGQALSVFGWFEIPATIHGFGNQEDIAGVVHEWLANGMIALVVLHSLAALKHHFIDRDPTLRRMLGLGRTRTRSSSITTRPEG
jgi:cytochrome b561